MKHAYYTECPDCGAHLDPNEHCNCLEMRESTNLYVLQITGTKGTVWENGYAIIDPDAKICSGNVIVARYKGIPIIGRYKLTKSSVLESFYTIQPLEGAPIIVDSKVQIVGKVNSIAFGEREAS